ncbi:GTP-binding nuclear protein Ran [Drosophila persimilis]|uniref:GTP-binding nuclear protein Ran n=1 Tax=Drosophila persimilis TaxID=7234 RepID=UPI000F07C04B|nr:GTP-binding nuclear protein Ran [Drosophila persimilis]
MVIFHFRCISLQTRPSPIPTFKCVIVGKEGCGKSTFIHRHLTGHFEQKYLPTFGITVIKLIFPTTRGPICFEMWEGGKAEYVQYRNPFFKNVQCAIVMFDLSLKDPFKNFDEYYSMSNMLPSDILKFVCGNKADQELGNPSPLPTNIHRCTKMSVKTNMNTLLPFLHLSRRIFKDPSLEVMPRTTLLPAQVEPSRQERQPEQDKDL